jgi:chemotaxis protein methyltransferase CheR
MWAAPVTWTADPTDVARFRDLIRLRTGMAVPESRTSDLYRALHRAAVESAEPDSVALYRRLQESARPSDCLDALVSALNVSETHFFRDSGQMRALERHILPELIDRRAREQRPHLRLWSAGCSTGEEAYTLAILVTRLLTDLTGWDVVIRATDINRRSLDRARRGVYGTWSLRGTSPHVLSSSFVPRGGRFEVVPRIRSMVTFAQLNLAGDAYPSPVTDTQAMDVILCRNVLMYFDEEGARAVIGRLRNALDEHGWLLVSQVEAGLRIFDGLAQDAPGTAIYRKADRGSTTHHARRRPPAPDRGAAGPEPRAVAAPPPRPGPAPRPRRPTDADDTAVHDEALTLWRGGRPDAALDRLEAVTDSRPLAPRLHYLRGLILLDRERSGEALAAFRRCTCADPQFALGYLAQAGVLARTNRPGRARAALDTAARLVAELDPAALPSFGDGVTVGDVRDLIATQRELLGQSRPPEAIRG